MAVAYGGTNVGAVGNAQTPTFSITVSGTNAALATLFGLDSATATVTSHSFSLGGTDANISTVRNGTCFAGIRSIAAPGAGAGTLTVGKSAATITHHVNVILYTGADQTTPLTTDTASSITTASSQTLTPANLTANDGSTGVGANTVSNNPGGVTPNQRYLSTTSSVNLQTGDNTGTSGVTFLYDNPDAGAGSIVKLVARIQQPTGGGGGSNRPYWSPLSSIGQMGRHGGNRIQ